MNKSLILVVEDDTSVRNLITTTLKTHEYRYLTAPDGQHLHTILTSFYLI
jgi:two-component system KDP operon response regulator KdpE